MVMKQVAIEVKDLVKRYRKADKNAVDGVSFEVKSGEVFTLLGPNGAGKTTTVSVLTTTLSKTRGELKVAGYDVDKNAAQVRRRIGIIFQKPSLDGNLTAEENIRFHAVLYGLYAFSPRFEWMPKDYQKRVKKLAGLLGIEDDLKKPIKTFSGGMKRKLEIVRSLIHEPEVLFLDEPTTGLDPESRKNLWDYLQEVRQRNQMTIFLTTHYLNEAEDADQVCMINHGKIVVQGSPRQIKHELVKAYVLADAEDREKLIDELKAKGLPYSINHQGVKMTMKDLTAQEIIRSIKTKLTVLDIHNPTLEEAYLEIVGNGSLGG